MVKAASIACAILIAKQQRLKHERKEIREAKARIKTRGQWLADVEKAVNAYIRLRDQDQPCISCGTVKPVQYAAGHYRSKGACPELRFNELNIHKQCNRYCNKELSGNIRLYRPALIKKIGLAAVEWLEGPHESKKYTIPELIELKTLYTRKRRELEKDRL